MGKSRQLKRRSSLQTTLSAWLLLVALVPLLTALGIIVAQSDAALRLATRSTLQDVAEQQSRALNEYLAARQRDALLVAQWPPVQSTLFQSSNGQSDPTGATTRNASIRPLLKSLVGLSGIADILLVDQTGTVVLAHNAAYDGQRLSESSTLPPAIQLVVERAQTLFASDISDLVMVPGRPTPVIYLAAPVLHAGRIVGAVVVELQTTSIPYLTDADGLQRTGEIAVGQRQGDQVLLLMPRIGPDGVKLTGALVPLERDPLMARSSAGDHGFGEVTDDQHVAVVAVWRYLPAYRWGNRSGRGLCDAAFPAHYRHPGHAGYHCGGDRAEPVGGARHHDTDPPGHHGRPPVHQRRPDSAHAGDTHRRGRPAR